MSRDICIYLDFLTDAHRAQIRQACQEGGFLPHFFTTEQFEEARTCLAHCEILYACSPRLLRTAPATLQWYCSAFAGVDPYCKDDGIFANPACLLTNSNVYGATIAEHVVMVLLMMMRRMPEYGETLRRRTWGEALPIRSIRGTDFTVLGTGDIGTQVALRLRDMGARRVIGLSRSGTANPAFDRVFPISRLEEHLPQTQGLILALPATPETYHILNRARIALLPEDAYVVNVGRGTAVEQEALMDALNAERLSGAALDVMEPEPLPPEHPLWETKRLLLTPHISGNLTLGYTCDQNVAFFCQDLIRYTRGLPLEHLVDRARGY